MWFFLLSSITFWCTPPWKTDYNIDTNTQTIGFWYYNGSTFISSKTLEDTDFYSFEIINSRYARDKVNLYSDWVVLEWPDPLTFEIVAEYPRSGWKGRIHLWKDKSNIWYNWEVLEWADVTTFESVNRYFHKDKDTVYFQDQIVDWANSETFEIIDDKFATDLKYFYNWITKLGFEITYPDTLEVFPVWVGNRLVSNSCWPTKKEYKYYFIENGVLYTPNWTPEDKVDIKTLKNSWIVLWTKSSWDINFVLVDKNSAYMDTGFWIWLKEIEWIDAASFKFIWNWFSKDNNHVYRSLLGGDRERARSIVEWVDASSFEMIRWDLPYFLDKDYVYKNSSKLFLLDRSAVKFSEWGDCITDDKWIILCNNKERISFLPNIRDKIDSLFIEKIVPNYSKVAIKLLLNENLQRKNHFELYKSKNKAIHRLFFSYVYENLDRYYQ